jgi:PIN domain nuclease of toxin-antitoxin system
MLAHLRGEPGGALVTSILGDVSAKVYAHSVNLVEVRYSFGAPSVAGNSDRASAALASLFAAGVQERRDNDGAFFEDLALLIAERRAMPRDPARPQSVPTLALGDAFGLALARRLRAPFVTADQSEVAPMQAAGFGTALFIR